MLLVGSAAPGPLHVLHVNDVRRISAVDDGDSGGIAWLTILRTQLQAEYPDLLLLHGVDIL